MRRRETMKKILIFGNSGSGKSTLAKIYSSKYKLPHFDLDTIAWENTTPPTRKPVNESEIFINKFTSQNSQYVIEGGYTDLLNIVSNENNYLIFLNPGIDICTKNCKNRPWEPHKYKSMEEQSKNLQMLLNWVKEYYVRNDEFSYIAHSKLYNNFKGDKIEYNTNQKIA